MKRLGICPFIGSVVDPDTARGYPTEQNCCYRARPVSIMNLDHQANFCLTVGYPNCLVFQNKEGLPLPKELVYRKARSIHPASLIRSKNWLFVGFILILVIGMVMWLSISSGYLHLF